jgi:aminoglycoside phosphotransferase
MKLQLPSNLERSCGTLDWEQVNIGGSYAKVYRAENFVLKVLVKNEWESLAGEKSRMEWLKGKLFVSEVVGYETDETFEYLLMTRLFGKNAAQTVLKNDPTFLVNQIGRALRELHNGIDIANCPFDMCISRKLEKAAYHLNIGLDWDGSRASYELLTELTGMVPDEDLVFTHGDYCLPNIIIDEEKGCVVGFVDLGRAGVADRYADLALGLRSIQYNLGEGYEKNFLEAYGHFTTWDQQKIEFYQRLDEF